MASDTNALASAIEARLLGQWDENAIPVFFAGVQGDPPASLAMWMRCTVRFGNALEDTMGADGGSTRSSLIVGVIYLQLYAKPGKGDGPLIAAADDARDVFNMQDFSGIRCGPSSPPAAPSDDRQGWRGVAVATPFEADELT